jgi:hypothetical protein
LREAWTSSGLWSGRVAYAPYHSRIRRPPHLLGKLCLVRELDPAGLTTWTVKSLTGIQLGGDERLTLQLESLNPAYAPRQLTIGASSDTTIDAVLLERLPTQADPRRRTKA